MASVPIRPSGPTIPPTVEPFMRESTCYPDGSALRNCADTALGADDSTYGGALYARVHVLPRRVRTAQLRL
jgi:hypothetical protein